GSAGGSNVSTPSGGQSAPAGNSANATPSAAATQVPQVQSGGTQAVPGNSNPHYDLIDFNKNLPGSFPWLAWIFGIIDILLALGVAMMAWRWKKGVWLWSYLPRRQANLLDLNKMSSELQEVIDELQRSDTQTVLAVQELLKRGRNGQKLLQTMVNLPDSLLTQIQALRESELELLFQVSRVMREQKGGMSSVN
ncbi:MAG TPA: hypothetical protein VHQ46_04570, partial [Desulfobacteria bacterium]|nr:hypothetical protein [Desulfobacteria bacterium]